MGKGLVYGLTSQGKGNTAGSFLLMCEYVYYFFIALNVSKSLEKLLRALLQEANLGSDVLFVVSILQLCNCTGYG